MARPLWLIHTFFSATIVLSTFVRVGEDFVGISNVMEFQLGNFIALVLVWMVLQGQLAVRFLDVCGLSIFLELKDLIEVSFGSLRSLEEEYRGKDQAEEQTADEVV